MNKNLRRALIIGGIVLGALIVLPLVLGPMFGGWSGGWGMMGPGMMGGFGGMELMSLVWIVILGLITWAVVAAVRRPAESTGSANSAMNVLQRRYARGEINKEEYENKKKDLALTGK